MKSTVIAVVLAFATAATAQINTAVNQIGRLTSIGNSGTRTFFEYDALGRNVATEIVQDGAVRTFSKTYGYLQAGVSGPGALITSETLPDGEIQSYAYDAGEEKVAIRSQPAAAKFAEDVVRDLRRNARGELTSVTFGNGAITTRSYNDTTDLRLSEIKTVLGVSLLQDSRRPATRTRPAAAARGPP